jgi:hypothetical protein
VQDKLRDAVSIKDFGVVGTADDLGVIQAAINTGKNVYIPATTSAYNVSGPILVSTPGQTIFGDGDLSALKLVLGSGANATPAIWVQAAATGASVRNLSVDGNNTSYIAPGGGSSIAYGDTIVVEADDAVVSNVLVKNSWDNGISVIRFASGHTGQTNGSPARVQITNIRGANNGKGTGTGGGGGATVNNLSGSKTLVSGVTDNASAVAVTEDTAGGAGGNYSNITGMGNTAAFIYIGSGDSVWSNLKSQDAAIVGIWIDSTASNVVINGFDIKASAQEAFRLKGCNQVTLNGGMITSAGFGTSNTYAAISIDTTPGNMAGIYINNVVVNHVGSVTNSYGIQKVASNTITGCIIGGTYEGATADFNTLGTTMPYLYVDSNNFLSNAPQRLSFADATIGWLLAGATKGARFVTDDTNGVVLCGVDSTGASSFQPFRVAGSTLALVYNGVTTWGTIGTGGLLNVTGGSFGRGSPVTKTADFTVAASENWLINNKAAATCTVTLPAAASFIGREITIQNYQAFTVVSASSNVGQLAGTATNTAILSANAGRWVTLVSDGVKWVIMAGVP